MTPKKKLLAQLSAYEVEGETLKNFADFSFANSLFWALSEGYASEMAARRTAMENATKNAGKKKKDIKGGGFFNYFFFF